LMSGEVFYAVATDDLISEAINKYYPLETSKEMMEELGDGETEELEFGSAPLAEKDIMEMANDAPIVKLVNHMLLQAAKESASDIHIEPFERDLRVRYRIDGNMYLRLTPPKRYQGAIVSRIKIMANLNIAEKRIPQDGRIHIKVADKPFDIRVSVLPSNYGERVVMRLLDKSKGIVDLERLNLSDRDFKLLTNIIGRPNGIVLVSGPTGSGKTTTLYSILNRLNQPDVTIITVEDPVEYTLHGINQVQVNEKAGLSFAIALRSILRQDPDVVLIGEIRDAETAQIATQAALTGHLVLSTIHTNSAPATITRLLDMGTEPFLIASSLICVISQRLVRRLCDTCKESYTPTIEMVKRLGLSVLEAEKITFYQPKGCDECLNMGFKGRLPVFEIMEVNDEIAKLIVQRADSTLIRKKALEHGMILLGNDGIRQIRAGLTTVEEILTIAYVQEPIEEI
jgi:general secretion pathway protein E